MTAPLSEPIWPQDVSISSTPSPRILESDLAELRRIVASRDDGSTVETLLSTIVHERVQAPRDGRVIYERCESCGHTLGRVPYVQAYRGLATVWLRPQHRAGPALARASFPEFTLRTYVHIPRRGRARRPANPAGADRFGMPGDGDIWLKDSLSARRPPCPRLA